MKINRVTSDKHKYLGHLSTIPKPLKNMFFLGALPSKHVPTVAIVGTWKPTSYGKEVAYKLSFDFAKRGVVIVSGLALGTDSVAHWAALEAGGTTLAVLANSVDHIYPRSHAGLAEQIIRECGAILSQLLARRMSSRWLRHNYSKNNRLTTWQYAAWKQEYRTSPWGPLGGRPTSTAK